MVRREDVSKEEWDAYRSAQVRSELTNYQLSALNAIIAGQYAWSHEGELCVCLGCDPEDLKPVLDELVGLGLIEHDWTLGKDALFTLTEYGAWVMQVHILERTTIDGEELSEDPYWAELRKEPPSIKLPKRRHETRWPWMDELPDPKAEQPVDAVMIDEVSGNPVLLLGRTVRIDRRLAKGGAKAQPKRRRAG